jgi:molybdate transport system substrate-binding protein
MHKRNVNEWGNGTFGTMHPRALISLALVSSLGALCAELQVAAAADLAGVQPAVAASFLAKTGNSIRWITGSSGVLARQAENGAPFDVFLSASESYVNELVAGDKCLNDTVAVYATGRIGLWSAKGSIQTLEALLAPAVQHVAIANPSHAPYGLAAKEALETRGLWTKLQGKIVYAENVRQALQFGESGNADAVLTAWSLIHAKNAVLISDKWHKPVRQAGVVLRDSKQPDAGRAFLRFLTGREGQALLSAAGFSAVRK